MGNITFAPLPTEEAIVPSTEGSNIIQFAPTEGSNREKLNLFQDDVYDIQQKLELDYAPYVDIEKAKEVNEGFQFGDSAGYGFANSVSGAVYHASAIPGWVDRGADWAINAFGGDADKWTKNYLYGDSITDEAGVTNYKDYIEQDKLAKERNEFRKSLDDSYFKSATHWALRNIDSKEEYLKGISKSITPTSMFDIDPYFQPQGVAENVVAGFGGMPVAIAEIAAATVTAGVVLTAAGVSSPVLAAGAGFAALSFLGSYEQEPEKVLYNTVVGFGEGIAFGALNRLPGWKSRTVALGSIGATSAALHGGGSTEMIAGAINLASLGAAGRGIYKLTGKDPLGSRSEPEKTADAVWTFLKAQDILRHDITRLDVHQKVLKQWTEGNRKGFYVEVEGLPFELAAESKFEITKKSKKDLNITLGNIQKLEIVAGKTRKDIDSGKETITFKRTTKETKPEELAKGEKEIKEEVQIPREFVIQDGKLLDYSYHLDTQTMQIIPKAKVEVADSAQSRTVFNQKDAILDRYNNSKIINGNLKTIDATTIEISWRQLETIAKRRGKEHDWARKIYTGAKKTKLAEETNMLERFTKYNRVIDKNRSDLNRVLNIAARVKPNPGESKAKDAEELINALVEIKKDPKDGKDKIDFKKDEKGNYVERDSVATSSEVANDILSWMERKTIPLKVAGDASFNNITKFVATKIRQLQNREDAALNDNLYRQEMTRESLDKIEFIEEKKGFFLGNTYIKEVGNALTNLKMYRSKKGSLTLFEDTLNQKGVFDIKGQKQAVKSLKKIIDSMIAREILMEKKAQAAAKGKTQKEIKAEYLKKDKRGKNVYQMSYEAMMKEFKLTPEELTIVRRLDEGLMNARIYHNKEMEMNPAAGKKIEELPNYYPHAWIGNHRIYMKDPTTGQLIGSIVGNSAKDVRSQFKMFIEKNPEYKDLPFEYVKKDASAKANGRDLHEAFFEASRLMETVDPKLSTALKESYRMWQSKQGFAKVKSERRGVVGNIAGSRAGMEGLRDFITTYKSYVAGAIKTAESARFKRETDGLFNASDPRVNFIREKVPQQYKFMEEYVDNYFGRNANAWSQGLEKALATLGRAEIFERLPAFNQVAQGINTATLHTKLLFFNVRFLASQVVQPYQMAPQRLAFLQKEFNIPGDIGKSLVEGTYLTFKPTAEFMELVQLAVKNKVIDAKFLNEFGIDVGKGGQFKGPFKRGFDKLAGTGGGSGIATGKSLSGMMERHSRLNSLAIMYSFLKSAKYDVKNGKEQMFKDAMWNTEQLMVEYNAPNRALMYTNKGLGPLGSGFGLFKTFYHNYMGQTAQYARTIAKNPKDVGSWKPMLFHQVSSILTAGMFGALSVAQVDGLIWFINKTLHDTGVIDDRIPNLTETILKSDLPIAAKFGIPSALAGSDISSTMAAPGFGPGDIFSLPGLDYLFGLTSKTNEGVIGSGYRIFEKKMNGTYTDADLYKFYKATMPPIIMAEMDRRYAGVPVDQLLGYGKNISTITDKDSIYFNSTLTRDTGYRSKVWTVANPYKGMRGAIERDIEGFQSGYIGGKSFEESLILKTIWATTKMSRNQKSKMDAIITAGAYEALNGRYDHLMPLVDMAIDNGYTYEEYMEKVTNRMKYMNNTVLDRVKGLSKTYNINQRDFIYSVIQNNNINLEHMPGSNP